MADTNKYSPSIGLRYVRVALRDTDGTIAIPSGWTTATAYNGLRAHKAVALTPTVPEPNRVQAFGDDRVYHTFMLPPDEGVTGELRTTAFDTELVALITGTKQWGSSPIRKVGLATDNQGEEPSCICWGSAQAVDIDPSSGTKVQAWQTYIFLDAQFTPRPAARERASIGEMTYAMVANDSMTDEVGAQFSEATHGFTEAPFISVITRGKFGMCAWKGNGSTTVFNLPSGEYPLYSGSSPEVYVNGVRQTSGVTVNGTAGTVTFSAAPASGAKIVALYEY
jgi:hypothetical protein